MTTHEQVLKDRYVQSGRPEDLAALTDYMGLKAQEPLRVPVKTAAEARAERKVRRRRERMAAAWRWGRAVRLALAICVLALGVAAGANWLSNQPWGNGPVAFTCDQGSTLHWRTLHDGNILMWCK